MSNFKCLFALLAMLSIAISSPCGTRASEVSFRDASQVLLLDESLKMPFEIEAEEEIAAEELAVERTDEAGPREPPIQIYGGWIGQSNVHDSDETLGYTAQQFKVAFPLQINDSGVLIGSVQGQLRQFQTDVILPDSRVPFPSALYSVEAGLFRIKNLAGGGKLGGQLQFGSASDQPFATADELTATVLGFYEVPTGDRDAWQFSVFYSPTSQINFPIPGIAYVWNPNSNLTANIGIPASLQYRPNSWLELSAKYTPVTNGSVSLITRPADKVSCFISYRVDNEVYWLSEREIADHRFFLFQQTANIGIIRELMGGFAMEGSVRYLMDRRFFQAESFGDDRFDLVELESGWFLSFGLTWNR